MKQKTKDAICAVSGMTGACGMLYAGGFCTSLAALVHAYYPNKLIAAIGAITIQIAGTGVSIYAAGKTYNSVSEFMADLIDNLEWENSVFYMDDKK